MDRTPSVGASDVSNSGTGRWPSSGETGKKSSGQDRSVLVAGDNVKMDFFALIIYYELMIAS